MQWQKAEERRGGANKDFATADRIRDELAACTTSDTANATKHLDVNLINGITTFAVTWFFVRPITANQLATMCWAQAVLKMLELDWKS